MKIETKKMLCELIETYNRVMKVMEHDAAKSVRDDARAYGGFIRAAKGKMQEYIAEELIRIAWITELSKSKQSIEINSSKIKVPIKVEYVQNIRNKRIRDYILSNIRGYHYGLSVDKHVFINNKFVMGVECKAYAENAMLKRILVDFYLLKTLYPDLVCFVLQLESMLGGDYHDITREPKGSRPTHTLMSYFDNIDLKIVTLLPGERHPLRPINKIDYFKPLTTNSLEIAIEALVDGFREGRLL